jgi:hypothetical protein
MQVDKIPYQSNSYRYLKPEVFCAEINQNGLQFDKIIIKHEGGFKKSYRNETGNVCFVYNDKSQQEEMEVSINRNGIYDRLPEGLFHQTKGNSKLQGVKDMVDEYRRFKEEEKNVRKFFQPLEQEIFRYSVLVEQEEQQISLSMLDGTLKNELFRFWGIAEGLPDSPVKVLLSIIPWVAHIKGNRLLTAKSLALMLGRHVTSAEWIKKTHTIPGGGMALGIGELGFTTVTGSTFQEPSVQWTFTITELSKKELALYPPQKPFGKFLKQFEEIFIPLTIDIIFEFELLTNTDDFEEETLGYSLVL